MSRVLDPSGVIQRKTIENDIYLHTYNINKSGCLKRATSLQINENGVSNLLFEKLLIF